MGALWATARTVNPPSYVLQAWEPHTELHGISSPPYIVLVRAGWLSQIVVGSWVLVGTGAGAWQLELVGTRAPEVFAALKKHTAQVHSVKLYHAYLFLRQRY